MRAGRTMCSGARRARGGSCRHGRMEAARRLHREPHGVHIPGLRGPGRAVPPDRRSASARDAALCVHDVPELPLQHLRQPRARAAPPGPDARLAGARCRGHAVRGLRPRHGALRCQSQPRLRRGAGVQRARGRGGCDVDQHARGRPRSLARHDPRLHGCRPVHDPPHAARPSRPDGRGRRRADDGGDGGLDRAAGARGDAGQRPHARARGA